MIEINEVDTEVYFLKGKTSIKPLKKQKYGHFNQIQVQESVMHGEGISTPRHLL